MQLLRTALSAALLVSSALAQGITITTPIPGTTVTAGSNITVQIGTNIYSENVEPVAIAIGLQSCGSDGCTTADQGIGTILYKGLFNPQLGPDYHGPYQDFELTVPESTPTGPANLAVAEFYLTGDSELPQMVFTNASLTVA